MYDQENDDPPASDGGSYQAPPEAGSAEPPSAPQSAAVIIHCPYCRKEFDRATTKSMPFCSSRCKQIDLGLWLNEVHGMPYDIDPGIS